MVNWAKWLQISGYGLEILGAAVGGWYVTSKFSERVKKRADEGLISLSEPPREHETYSPSGIYLNSVTHIPQRYADTDIETAPEELMSNRFSSLMDPLFNTMWNWGEKLAQKLKPLGWLRYPLLVALGLVFFALFCVWVGLLVPVMIVRYVIDPDIDFRLRIIVLVFGVGIILQIISAIVA